MINNGRLILDMRKEMCVRLYLQRSLFLSSFDQRFNLRANSIQLPCKLLYSMQIHSTPSCFACWQTDTQDRWN